MASYILYRIQEEASGGSATGARRFPLAFGPFTLIGLILALLLLAYSNGLFDRLGLGG